MKNERRSIVVGQAVDDLPDASVHFVYDDSFIDKAASIRQGIRFAHVNDTEPAVGLTKIIGGGVCGDRERPRLDTGAATEGVEPPSYSKQGFLEKIVSDGSIPNQALEVPQESGRQILGKLLE